MKRRAFITLLGGAAAWPLAARAQQAVVPVIGVLDTDGVDSNTGFLRPFRQGLGEAGYFEGQNVAIEYRWAEGQYDRLPQLAADLVQRKVSVIAIPSSTPASVAAKNATTTIPIVFGVGEDPVRLGLVTSLGRPGGNATGINFLTRELGAKRLGLLQELVPTASRIAVLANPTDPVRVTSNIEVVETAARAIGLQIHVFNASTTDDIDRVHCHSAGTNARAVHYPRCVLRHSPRATCNLGCAPCASYGISAALLRRSGRADELWDQPCRCTAPCGHLYRSGSQGREARRPAGAAY